MKYETVHNVTLPKIGFGTVRLGGSPFTAYMPVKFKSAEIASNNIIRSIAQAHTATPFQIALAWLTMQPRVITIPMSFNPQHQKENFTAADIELTHAEINQLNKLA